MLPILTGEERAELTQLRQCVRVLEASKAFDDTAEDRRQSLKHFLWECGLGVVQSFNDNKSEWVQINSRRKLFLAIITGKLKRSPW